MIVLLALLAATPSAAPAERLDPIDAFRRVCIEGQASFRKGVVLEVPLSRVPWDLAPYHDKFERFFLSADRKTLIAVATPSKDGQLCAVITASIDKRRIYELGFPLVGSDSRPPLHDQDDIERTLESSAGYQIVASRYGRNTRALTTYILTPAEKIKQQTEMELKKRLGRVANGYYSTTTTTETK